MSQLFPDISERQLCDWLHVNRSTVWRRKTGHSQAVINLERERQERQLVQRIHELVLEYPTWGYRRVWAWLKFKDGVQINKKKVERIMRQNNWQARCIIRTPRPRVAHKRSVVGEPNERWAMDATSTWCAADGWIGLMAVIDCCTREIIGLHVGKRGRAQEAEQALEEACLKRFGLVYPAGEQRPVLRSDNGKVFVSKRFTGRCRQYGLTQEYITPYTPQQNGMIERFFRSLKEECIWQHNFKTFDEARDKIEEWVEFYNTQRPHQALNYRTPSESFQQLQQVA